MPSNGKNRRKRNPRHKKDFQDRAATFTSEDVISKSELNLPKQKIADNNMAIGNENAMILGSS